MLIHLMSFWLETDTKLSWLLQSRHGSWEAPRDVASCSSQGTSPYFSLPLPTSPYLSLPLPTSPYLSLLLPTSPYLSLTLPTSPYISLPLPTSPYLSLHLPKPQTQAALENRKTIGGRIYRGEMQRWNEFQGWGFIQADPDLPLPAHVQARLCRPGSVYVRKADVAPGVRLQKGLLVMFQVFIDDQDVRACGLQLI
jgi:hypothetical protein